MIPQATSFRMLPLVRRRRRGFTLLETALAMVIVTVGVVAIIDAFRAFNKSNSWSSQEGTATYLANELRELTRRLPRHDPVTGLTKTGGGVLVGLGKDLNEDQAVIEDYDDLDDFISTKFGTVGPAKFNTQPGPINAFGEIIYETDVNGEILKDGFGNDIPLMGWSQVVTVEKVNPFDFTDVLAWTEEEAPSGSYPGRRVGAYPLRVSVTVYYQGPYDANAEEMVTLTWIVP
jgi:prepilin-type N-terminal cleavage/methylation domain-containing protein